MAMWSSPTLEKDMSVITRKSYKGYSYGENQMKAGVSWICGDTTHYQWACPDRESQQKLRAWACSRELDVFSNLTQCSAINFALR